MGNNKGLQNEAPFERIKVLKEPKKIKRCYSALSFLSAVSKTSGGMVSSSELS